MNQNTRIELKDTMFDIFHKMSEGNPGAMTTCMELLENGEKIDPDDFMGGLGKVLSLDTLGIYGTDIYALWSDICKKNTAQMCTILRGWQLGYISGELVADVAHRQDYSGVGMINIEEVYNKVKTRLPKFDPNNEAGFTFIPVENTNEL